MSKLLITTQVYENYGDADQPYWKPKGGVDYVVKNIDVNRASDIVNLVSGEIECNNEMFREYLIGWEVVANDYHPHYFQGDTYSSEMVTLAEMTAEEITAYTAGYNYNEKFGDKKDWG
jgi:hypothetical protein